MRGSGTVQPGLFMSGRAGVDACTGFGKGEAHWRPNSSKSESDGVIRFAGKAAQLSELSRIGNTAKRARAENAASGPKRPSDASVHE